MAAGVPGTGIGGLFYLAMAVLMPLRKLAGRRHASPARRWRAIGVQYALVVGILVAMSATAWGVSALVRAVESDPVVRDRAIERVVAPSIRGPVEATILSSVLALALVVGLVQVLRLVVPRRDAP